jgi:hypothetical protein
LQIENRSAPKVAPRETQIGSDRRNSPLNSGILLRLWLTAEVESKVLG